MSIRKIDVSENANQNSIEEQYLQQRLSEIPETNNV